MQNRTTATGWFLGALAALAVVPWVFRFLPFMDYPVWLAEAHAVAELLRGNPDYRALWIPAWQPTPNILAMLAMAGLTLLANAEFAGKVLVSVYAVAFPLCMLVIGGRVKGGWVPAGTLGSLWVFNHFLYNGNISYLLGLTLALAAVIALQSWSSAERKVWRVCGFALLSLACYFTHLFGYLVLLAAVFSFCLLRWLRHSRSLYDLAPLVVQALPLTALAAYTLIRTGNDSVSFVFYDSLTNKIYSFVEPFFVTPLFSPVYEFPFASVVNALLVLGVLTVLALGRARLAWSYISLAGALLVAAGALAPFAWFASLARPDERLIFPGVLLLLAAMSIEMRPARLRALTAFALLGLSAFTLIHWSKVQPGMSAVAAALSELTAENQNVVVLNALRAPVRQECRGSIGNTGAVANHAARFLLQYATLDSDALVYAPLFSTALVRPAASTPPAGFHQIHYLDIAGPDLAASSPDTQAVMVGPGTSVILSGCPADLRQIEADLNPALTARAVTEFARIFTSEVEVPLLDIAPNAER